jgi:hypothetical protein
MLQSDGVAYTDVVGLLSDSGGGPEGALLSVIFADARGDNADILAGWLADARHDAQIVDKSADTELRQLIASRLGLELSADEALADARRRTARYVLVGEFQADLGCESPAVLQMIPRPGTKDQRAMVADVAQKLRQRHAEAYVALADTIEAEFSLPAQSIPPAKLGSVDTFRFEEQLLLDYAAELISGGQFKAAGEVVSQRRMNFWSEHEFSRHEQWRVHELMAQLGEAVDVVTRELPNSSQKVGDWVQGYTAPEGWHRVDSLHRRLESAHATMSQEIASEQALTRVRSEYHELLGKMSRGFISALKEAGWNVPGILRQTDILAKKGSGPGEVTAWFLVDALRYEMGVELARQLDDAGELSLAPAIAAVPTITPVGMAALLPGAEGAFSVIEQGGKLAVRAGDSVVTDLAGRRKVWKGRMPGVVDLELDKVLSLKRSELKGRVEKASAILVRSLEIDAMGENVNTMLARQMIDTAIGNVVRAVKRLARLGVSRFVITADHGHLFVEARDESQRIDSPGGETIEMHRRCWVGRGGSNTPGTVRINGSQFGYDTDLDFVFPAGDGVFKAGGDLAYYHGGLSLQELVVPVLTVKMPMAARDEGPEIALTLSNVPNGVSTRLVRVDLISSRSFFTEEVATVYPVLLSKGVQVGHGVIVLDGELDEKKHLVKLTRGKPCSVGLQLLRDDVDSIQIVVLDPATDRVLAQSKNLPVKLDI